MAFNFKGIGNWFQEKVLEPIDDILKGEVGRIKEDVRTKVDEGVERAKVEVWDTVLGRDDVVDNGVQVAGVSNTVLVVVITSIVMYLVIKGVKK